MKNFFKDNSYTIFKMFVNQLGMMFFGLVLSFATQTNDTLFLVASAFSIVFYLFLLYTMTWDIGFREKVSVDNGRIPKRPLKGALISLCANSVNFLFAIFITLANFVELSFIGTLGGIGSFCGLALEGMYLGVLSNTVGGVAISSFWWVWFLIPIPAILTCAIAYYMGLRDFKLTAGLTRKKKK